MNLVRAAAVFGLTAILEILGCYLPYLWLRKGGSVWLVVPAAASLAGFVWLLTQHPTGAARTYAAYGGMYVAIAVLWLWIVEGQRPTAWDIVGSGIAVAGMAIIVAGHRGEAR